MREKRVYIIKNHLGDNVYKVGMSINPDERARAISRLMRLDLKVVYATDLIYNPRSIERQVHESLEKYSLDKEWFNVDLETIIKTIESLKDQFSYVDDEEIDLTGVPPDVLTTGTYDLHNYTFRGQLEEIEPHLYKDIKNEEHYIVYKTINETLLFRATKYKDIKRAMKNNRFNLGKLKLKEEIKYNPSYKYEIL